MDKHVFFTDALGAGGISTNVVALAGYVAAMGNPPIIVTLNTRQYSQSIWDYCQQISSVVTVANLLSLLLKSKNENYVFFVNSIRTLLIACFILICSVFRGHNIKIVFCVYHPREFSHQGKWVSTYRKLVCSLGKENIFFMNGACFSEHKSACNDGAVTPNYLPLVCPELTHADCHSVDSSRRCVLTVGRFVGFKLHYMRALLQFALMRPSVDFVFVGYGEGESELKEYVKINKLSNVRFLGMLDYSKLYSVYQNATCYVGMGTTLVEASSLGVPCVVATVGVPGDVCYGMFTEQQEYDVGEFRADKPLQSMSECLDNILALPVNELNLLRIQHQEFSKKFGIEAVGPTYLRLTDSAKITSMTCRLIAQWIGVCFSTLVHFVFWYAGGKQSRYDETLSNRHS